MADEPSPVTECRDLIVVNNRVIVTVILLNMHHCVQTLKPIAVYNNYGKMHLVLLFELLGID